MANEHCHTEEYDRSDYGNRHSEILSPYVIFQSYYLHVSGGVHAKLFYFHVGLPEYFIQSMVRNNMLINGSMP